MNDNIQTTNTAPELPSRPNESRMRQQLDQFNKIHKGETMWDVLVKLHRIVVKNTRDWHILDIRKSAND